MRVSEGICVWGCSLVYSIFEKNLRLWGRELLHERGSFGRLKKGSLADLALDAHGLLVLGEREN